MKTDWTIYESEYDGSGSTLPIFAALMGIGLLAGIAFFLVLAVGNPAPVSVKQPEKKRSKYNAQPVPDPQDGTMIDSSTGNGDVDQLARLKSIVQSYRSKGAI